MISNRDIVVIGAQPWDIPIGSNCKNIALEFSKNNRVLYVNEPLNRFTRVKDRNTDHVKKRMKIRSENTENLLHLDNYLWNLYPRNILESINWIPRHLSFLYEFFNKRNNKSFFYEIKEAIDRLDFKDVILFNDSLMFLGFYANEFLNPSISIYYIRDNLISQDYFARHGRRLEPLIAEKYDAVVANSDYLARYLEPYNEETYMIGQGCDLSLFNKHITNIPEDIKNIKGPLIGYIGFLTSLRLDIKLLEKIAKTLPDKSLVLVGPEDDDFKSSHLHHMSNVYFLGAKNPDQLPEYLSRFDVAINPQLVNDLTIGNYPRKIDEYLAMGKPVVATYTEAMEYFSDHVFLGKNHEQFIDMIKMALSDTNEERSKQRKAIANSHTWESSVKKIYQVINKVEEGKTIFGTKS